MPKESAEELVCHAESLDKFVIDSDSMGDVVSLDRNQSILMTYYRNNIIHLFAIPSFDCSDPYPSPKAEFEKRLKPM